MNKKQKLILVIISILIILIIIILLLLSMINKDNITENKRTDNTIINSTEEINRNNMEDYEEYDDISVKINNKLTYVNDSKEYFTINALVNNYINLIGYKNKEELKNILSTQYIDQYNITDNNIFSKLSIPETKNNKQYYKLNITDMLTAQVDSTTSIYIVNGKCRIVGQDVIFNIQVMFELDSVSELYYVYPYQYIKDNEYDKLKVGDICNYKKENITDKKSNKFNYSSTSTDKQMANEYFSNFNELLLYYKEDAYNKLNPEYAKKRFGNKDGFQTYLTDNKVSIALMSIDKYKVESYQDYTDYICSDKYNNIYIFRQQGGIMRYSVFLDNYTVILDEYIEEYNKLDKFDKGKYNLTKFINMVNTKDYDAIYNVLDTTFRTNNFKTQDSLKKYLQKNLYNLNKLEIIEYDNQSYDYYIFNCKITNSRNISETKNMTIIINQGEGTNYTMSFSLA